jgi:putative transcriptional regulator
MEKLPYSHLVKGTLLIASPDVETGIYFRSVILLCEHMQTSSFGLIINKQLEFDLPEEILNLREAANPKLQIRAGGPAQPNQMILLHSSETISEQVIKICDGVFLGGDLQFLQEAAQDPNGPYVRLCFGYV